MTVQIDLYRKQARWEMAKTVAVFLSATAAWAALILAVAHFLPQAQQQAPIVIQIPAQK